MAINEYLFMDLLKEADELLTRFRPQAVAPTWNHNMEVLGIFSVINQMWQDPNSKMVDYVMAMQPVIFAVFEMGREAERSGTG